MNLRDRTTSAKLQVQKWIGKDGESIAPFKLSDTGLGPKSCLPSSISAKVAICMGFRRYKKLHAALSSKTWGSQ